MKRGPHIFLDETIVAHKIVLNVYKNHVFKPQSKSMIPDLTEYARKLPNTTRNLLSTITNIENPSLLNLTLLLLWMNKSEGKMIDFIFINQNLRVGVGEPDLRINY